MEFMNLFMADGQKDDNGKYTSLGEQGVARRLRADLEISNDRYR